MKGFSSYTFVQVFVFLFQLFVSGIRLGRASMSIHQCIYVYYRLLKLALYQSSLLYFSILSYSLKPSDISKSSQPFIQIDQPNTMASLDIKVANKPRQDIRPLQSFPHELLLNIIEYTGLNGLRSLRATGRGFANIIPTKTLDQKKSECIGQMVDSEGQKVYRLANSLPNDDPRSEKIVRLSADESSDSVTALTCYKCLQEKAPSEFSAVSLTLPFFLPSPRLEGEAAVRRWRRSASWLMDPDPLGPMKPPALDRRCRTCDPDRYKPLPACIGCGALGGWKVCERDEWIASEGIYCKWDRALAPRKVLDRSQPGHQVGPFCRPCRTRYWDDRRIHSQPLFTKHSHYLYCSWPDGYT